MKLELETAILEKLYKILIFFYKVYVVMVAQNCKCFYTVRVHAKMNWFAR